MGTQLATGVDWWRVGASMVLVFGLLGAMLWTLKRMKTLQIRHKGEPKLQVLETLTVGPRQKIALLQVGNRQVLVGMSPSQFTALGSWEDSAPAQERPRES